MKPRVALISGITFLTLSGGADVPLAAQEPEPAVQTEEPSTLVRVAQAVGGAIIGGWVGWLGAQVSVSDWTKDHDSELMTQRAGWIGGGMLAGALISQLVGSTPEPVPRPVIGPVPDRGFNLLTRDDIQRSGATTAYQLIITQRRQWLTTRGTFRFSESARGNVDSDSVRVLPGVPKVAVYFEGTRLEDIEALRDVQLADLESIEFVDANRATTVYGAGHAHGVIVLRARTRSDIPRR
jgi:hypothetical protein